MLAELGEMVEELSLSEGVENSLLAKVEAAVGVLEDDNEKNDGAAVNILRAFINAASAQSGKKIAESQADALIAEAAAIIEALESGWFIYPRLNLFARQTTNSAIRKAPETASPIARYRQKPLGEG
jgi:hypothetical protein